MVKESRACNAMRRRAFIHRLNYIIVRMQCRHALVPLVDEKELGQLVIERAHHTSGLYLANSKRRRK